MKTFQRLLESGEHSVKRKNMKVIDLNILDYQDTVRLFHSETDRAAAVLAGSFLENYIGSYLRAFMIEDSEIDKLFDGFGPFSDFMKRIECAYAFGFISKEHRSDLTFIRKIRNHFAHHPLDSAFDKSPIIDWCGNLSTKDFYPLRDQPADLIKDNRHRFLIAIGSLVIFFHNKMLELEKQKNV